MLFRSDCRLLIIANGGEDWDWLPDHAWLLQPPGNLGVACSWNLTIKSYPLEDYWLIANDDVVFAPGDLARLVESEGYGWVGIDDWRAFKLTAEAVARVGLFDEGYHPIFGEDADWEKRCDIAGVRWGFIQGETSHVGSACLQHHRHDNGRTYPRNVQRYRDKWGVGQIRQPGGHRSPFDRGGSVADDTQADLSTLRANVWRDADD